MQDFLLILHDPAESPFHNLSPAEIQAVIGRYTAWAGNMAAEGRLKGSNKLEDGTARHLVGLPGQTTVTDGPFPETKEVVGGYILISAASYDEAVEIASTCPHLDFGRIEIRRVEQLQ